MLRTPNPKSLAPNTEHRTPNPKSLAPNAEHRTPNSKSLTPNAERRTTNSRVSSPNAERLTPNYFSLALSLDEVLSQVEFSPPTRILFGGEGIGAISSYVAGWMASRRIDVIVLDGANRFDPYAVSSFARKESLSPEGLLKSIRIARGFTCYQMATLMGEKLKGAIAQVQKPWVILLGPITLFLDEDIPEREVRPLFERSLKKVEILAEEGIPFFLFQSLMPSHSKRAYLMKRLFEFAHLVLRISLGDEGPRVTLEKGPKQNIIENCKIQSEKWKFPERIFPFQK